MAEAVGTVQIDVRANLDRLEQDLAKARSRLQQFDESTKTGSGSLSQIVAMTEHARKSLDDLTESIKKGTDAELVQQRVLSEAVAAHTELERAIIKQVEAQSSLTTANREVSEGMKTANDNAEAFNKSFLDMGKSALEVGENIFKTGARILQLAGYIGAATKVAMAASPGFKDFVEKITQGASSAAKAGVEISSKYIPAIGRLVAASQDSSTAIGKATDAFGAFGAISGTLELAQLATQFGAAGTAAALMVPAVRKVAAQEVVQGVKGVGSAVGLIAPAAITAVKALGPLRLLLAGAVAWAGPLAIVAGAFTVLTATFKAGEARLEAVAELMKKVDEEFGKVEPRKEILSAEEIAKADDLNRRLNAAFTMMQESWRPMLTDIGLLLVSIWVRVVEVMAEAVKTLGIYIDFFVELGILAGRGFMLGKESIEAIVKDLSQGVSLTEALTKQTKALAEEQRTAGRTRAAAYELLKKEMADRHRVAAATEQTRSLSAQLRREDKEGSKETEEAIKRVLAAAERRKAGLEAEIQTVGKSVGEQARMRTELQLTAHIMALDKDNIDKYKDKIRDLANAMGDLAQKTAEARLESEIRFETRTLRMPEADVEVQRRLRAVRGDMPKEHEQMLKRFKELYGNQVKPAVDEATEAQIRYNMAVTETVRTVRSIQDRTVSYRIEAATANMAAGAAAAYRVEQEFLHRAQQRNIRLTPQLRKEIADAARVMGEAADEAERIRIESEIRRERALMFLSPEEVQIANQLKGLFGNDIPRALASSQAAAMRMNNALREGFEFTHQALSSITKDLLQGTKLVDAIGKQVQRLADMLIDMAARKAAAAIFSPIADMLAGGTETAGVTVGASTAATTLTSGGQAAGAAIVAGAVEAAQILGFAGTTTGGEVAGGGITAGTAVTTGGTAGGTATAAGGTAGGAALASGGIAAAVALYGPILIFVAAIAAAGTLFMRARQQEQERREREQRRVELGVQVNQFIGGLLGGAGEVQRRIEDAQERTIDLMREAAEIWDLATIARLQEALNEFIRREEEAFRRTFQFRLEALRAGFGPESGFARARSEVAQAADQIRNFVTDVGEILGSPTSHDVREAQAAGREFLLSMVGVAPEMSETQQELERIRGTTSALQQALVDLGLSAEEAATAIEERTTRAIQALTERFSEDLVRDLREATGQGFLNEASDLIRDIERRRADAARLPGVDTSVIDRLFTARAQQIVDNARLMGEEFQALIRAFPELARVVHEFTDTVTRSAEETARVARDIEDEIFEAVVQTDTLEGQLATLERERRRRREEEVRAGGENLERLEVLFAIRRFNIIKEHNDRIVEETRRAEEERLDAIMRAAQTITDYLNQLNVTEMGGGTPLSRYTAAQAEFNRQLQLARGGDIEALENITESAEAFRRTSQEMFGSTARFQADLATIRTTLGGLPGVPAPGEDPTVAAINALAGPLGNIQTNTGTTSTNTGTTSTNTLGALQQLLFMLNNTEDISAYTGDMVTSTEDISANTLASLTRLLTVMTNTGNTATNTDDISQYTGGMVTNTSGILDETGSTATNTSNTAVNTQRALQQLVSVLTRLGDILTELSATTTAVGETTTAIGESNTEGLRSLLVTLNSLTEPMRRNSVISAQMMGNLRIIADNTRIGIFPLGVAVTTLPMGGTEAGNVFTGFQRGGVLNPYQYGIMGEHHPAGPFIMRAGALPVPITPDMPLLGANDNSMVAGLLRRLLDEISGLRRDVVRANVAAAEHVREGINEVTDQQRQNRREASFNSKRNAA